MRVDEKFTKKTKQKREKSLKEKRQELRKYKSDMFALAYASEEGVK